MGEREVMNIVLVQGRDQQLGITTTSTASSIISSVVPGGLVNDWNAQHPDSQVTAGAEILEINGFKGRYVHEHAALRDRHMTLCRGCKSNQTIYLRFRRAPAQ